MRDDIALIKARLADDLDGIVCRLLPGATGEAGLWKAGDTSGAAGGSLCVWTRGAKRGQWHDFATGEGGDLIDLIAACLHGGDLKAAMRTARDWTGTGSLPPEDMARQARQAEERRLEAERREAERQERLRRSAHAHYLNALPLAGTASARYLAGRGIDLKRLGRQPGSLRHREMRCPEHFERHGIFRPCLIAAVSRLGQPLVTIHRIFLHEHADGRVTKASQDPDLPMVDAKRAYGPFGGGWTVLARGASGRRLADADADEPIFIAEGIETGLSVALALPAARVLAAISLDNMARLALPEGRRLVLCADNDAKEGPRRAFARTVERLRERGFAVTVCRPPAPHKDFNDWAQALLGEAA